MSLCPYCDEFTPNTGVCDTTETTDGRPCGGLVCERCGKCNRVNSMHARPTVESGTGFTPWPIR